MFKDHYTDVLFMGFSRQEHWSDLPFPSPVNHNLSDLCTMTHPFWVAPQAWLSFIELEKAVVLVWLDWLNFCEYGFSVSALWCPLATLTILLGFLLLWAWGISSWLFQQSTAATPYLGREVTPLGCCPDHYPQWQLYPHFFLKILLKCFLLFKNFLFYFFGYTVRHAGS